MDRRWLLDTVTELAGRAHARRRYTPPPGRVYVNLGAGSNVAPGWVNIDGNLSALVANWPGPLIDLAWRFSSGRRWLTRGDYRQLLQGNLFIHHDLRNGIPLPDRSADVVYSAHFFEHVYRETAELLFRESLRVLKPGGLLRINVPDLAVPMQAFQEGRTEEALEFFFPWSPADEDKGYGRHRYLYDFELLAAVLEETGFVVVTRCAKQQTGAPSRPRTPSP